MMWREGLLIKLDKLGVGGRMFNWVKYGVGKIMSAIYHVDNGTPQGSLISHCYFHYD